MGPKYIKALHGPLPHLRLVPTGGIDVHNIGDFFKAGSAAVGIATALLSAKLLQEANWPELTRRAAEFLNAARAARSP